MKEITIKAPEGHEIDIKNSDISKGIVVFKKVDKLPESWKEYVENLNLDKKIGGHLEGKYYFSAYGHTGDAHICSNSIPANTNCCFNTKEERDAVYALAQLCQLRDRYNGEPLKDWCNWKQHTDKYCIQIQDDEIVGEIWNTIQFILAFKTAELRDKFLSCPEIVKLIEKAKPLL